MRKKNSTKQLLIDIGIGNSLKITGFIWAGCMVKFHESYAVRACFERQRGRRLCTPLFTPALMPQHPGLNTGPVPQNFSTAVEANVWDPILCIFHSGKQCATAPWEEAQYFISVNEPARPRCWQRRACESVGCCCSQLLLHAGYQTKVHEGLQKMQKELLAQPCFDSFPLKDLTLKERARDCRALVTLAVGKCKTWAISPSVRVSTFNILTLELRVWRSG